MSAPVTSGTLPARIHAFRNKYQALVETAAKGLDTIDARLYSGKEAGFMLKVFFDDISLPRPKKLGDDWAERFEGDTVLTPSNFPDVFLPYFRDILKPKAEEIAKNRSRYDAGLSLSAKERMGREIRYAHSIMDANDAMARLSDGDFKKDYKALQHKIA